MPDAKRRRTPGREPEKPAPGVNSRTEGGGQRTEKEGISNIHRKVSRGEQGMTKGGIRELEN